MSDSVSLPETLGGWGIVAWGVGGVSLILLNPILRLGATAWSGMEPGLTPLQWGAAAAWTAFMLYTEAYRGFHLQFSPRVVARALALARAPRPLPVLLAPLMCMGLLHATRRRLTIAWGLVTMIVVLIVAVRQLPPDWRAVVDIGVVIGLASGLLSVGWHLLRALRGNPPEIDPDLPVPRS